MFKNLRSFALGAVIAALALSSVPALSGSASSGAFQLLGASDGSFFARGVTAFEWQWAPGSTVTSNSVIDLRLVESTSGSLAMRKYRYVRWGSYEWDTTRTADGLYTVTGWLRDAPHVRSTVGPVYIDNTAPVVHAISEPSYSGIIVRGSSVTPETRIVSGSTTLAADTSDNLTGVETVEWWLDNGTEAAVQLDVAQNEDGTTTYDFSGVTPGEHTLTTVAVDRAGNRSADHAAATIDIVVVGAGTNVPAAPDPSEILPSDDPSPQPTPEPTLPELPELPDPNDPGTLPTPEPTQPEVPTLPEPDPSSTPQPPVPLPLP